MNPFVSLVPIQFWKFFCIHRTGAVFRLCELSYAPKDHFYGRCCTGTKHIQKVFLRYRLQNCRRWRTSFCRIWLSILLRLLLSYLQRPVSGVAPRFGVAPLIDLCFTFRASLGKWQQDIVIWSQDVCECECLHRIEFSVDNLNLWKCPYNTHE